MFILANCNFNEDVEFTKKEVQNKTLLERSINEVRYIGIEEDIPVNLIVVESSDSQTISLERAREGKLYTFEVVYETGIEQEEKNVYDLVNSFGTKKSIVQIKDAELHGRLKSTVTVIESKTQILPQINTKAETPLDSFLLEEMFGEEILKHFNGLDPEEISLQKEMANFKSHDKVRFLLSDALVKILKFRYYTKDMLEGTPYEPLMPLFIDSIEQRRLSKLAKDRLIIMLYILLLQIENGVLKTSLVPDLNMDHKAIVQLFKVLGCIYNERKKEVKWLYKPKESSKLIL